MVVVAALASPTSAKKPDAVARALGELHGAVGCPSETAPHRVWCVTTGWSAGQAPALTKSGWMLGLTIKLEQGQPASAALTTRVHLSALTFRVDQGKVKAKIIDIKPSNPDEEKALAKTVTGLAMVFKGKAASAPIDHGLDEYLMRVSGEARYPVKQGPRSWSFRGASAAELRKVGDVVVAIERPRSGPPGVFVSIFTDKVSLE